MPFDPAPQVEVETKVGRYQYLADAILRGCAMVPPATCPFSMRGGACVMGALAIGLGAKLVRHDEGFWRYMYREDVEQMDDEYRAAYGRDVRSDNDSGAFTREQIAARIAAL